MPDAWENGETNAAAVVRALSHKHGAAVPWGLVRDSLSEAVRSRWLETARGDGETAAFDRAGAWCLRVPRNAGASPAPKPQAAANVEVAAHQVQDLAEAIPKLLEASAGHALGFRLGVALDATAPEAVRREVDRLLGEVAPELKSDARRASTTTGG